MLIVEDGSGIANADSLVSVEFVDNFHNQRGNLLWADINANVKEQLIRKANDYLIAKYFNSWKGLPVSADQYLPFPRIINSLNTGVPILIKEALAELALGANSIDLMAAKPQKRKKVKVGPLEVEYENNSESIEENFPSAFYKISGYLLPTNTNKQNSFFTIGKVLR